MSDEENIKPSTEDNQQPAENENISKLPTTNHKLQTDMEVHKHPHHVTHKKKWGEYLLEFFMLFLAVFLGFVAENIREHSVEKKKEREYIKSMVEDLETDSAFLELSINKLIPYHLTWLDSTMNLLSMPDMKGKDKLVYQAFMIGTGWSYNFHPTERTLSQLHNAGYQLIRNKNTVKNLSQLEEQYKQFNSQIEPFVENMQNDLDMSAYVFADRYVTDTIAITAFQNFSDDKSIVLDTAQIPEGSTIDKTNTEGLKSYKDKLKKYTFYLQYAIKAGHVAILREVKKTIALLKKEYHLENE